VGLVVPPRLIGSVKIDRKLIAAECILDRIGEKFKRNRMMDIK
jgi:hypothetical protein